MFLIHLPRAIGHRTAHDFTDLRDLVNAHERVHFRQKFGQFLAEALRQAAGNDNGLAALIRVAQLDGFENRVHAFFLCGINERAGVDDDSVSLCGVVGDFDAVLEQCAEHDFGVHKVFGAAEGNQADAQRTVTGILFRHERSKLRELAAGVENYLTGTVTVFVLVGRFDGMLVETTGADGRLDSAGRPSCVRITERMA